LREYILERAATLTTFKQIALDNCQEAKMVQAIVKQAFLASEMSKSKAHPRVLGIDEIYFGRKRYTVLVDIESGKAVDLLKGRSAESIKPRFEEASNRVAVEYVTQDFSMSYRSATVKAPKPKGKKGGSDAASDSSISGWQLVLFAERGADGTEDPEEAERAVRMSREELAAMLPNAKIVGDHFHFAQAILTEFFKRALNMIRNWREELIRIGTMGSSNTSRARLQD
jgi:transposase